MMKSLTFSLCAFLFTALAAVAQDSEVIEAGDIAALRAKENTDVTVEGVVSKIEPGHEKKILSIGANDQRNGFAVMISDADLLNFPEGIEKYQGRKVRVFGRLLKQGDQPPRMRVKTPDKITIVES